MIHTKHMRYQSTIYSHYWQKKGSIRVMKYFYFVLWYNMVYDIFWSYIVQTFEDSNVFCLFAFVISNPRKIITSFEVIHKSSFFNKYCLYVSSGKCVITIFSRYLAKLLSFLWKMEWSLGVIPLLVHEKILLLPLQ